MRMRLFSPAGALAILLAIGLGGSFVALEVDPAVAQFLSRAGTGAKAWGDAKAGKRERHRPGAHSRGHRRDRSRYYRRHRHSRVTEQEPPSQDDSARVVPPAVRPPPVPVPVLQTPPDPQGPLRLTPARGAAAPVAAFRLGEPLASDQPHVTLDWRRYDLPEPPAGRIYGRVGRTVLLITVSGRIVEAVIPPG